MRGTGSSPVVPAGTRHIERELAGHQLVGRLPHRARALHRSVRGRDHEPVSTRTLVLKPKERLREQHSWKFCSKRNCRVVGTLTVMRESVGSSGLRRLARLAAFSTMLGQRSASWAGLSWVIGISHGSRNLDEDMKPGCSNKCKPTRPQNFSN